ncbi:hypothetical protein C0J52_15689 [Blattella germanica]|nr:hypothetical protein C0J52_15689 [Blattella germanica]
MCVPSIAPITFKPMPYFLRLCLIRKSQILIFKLYINSFAHIVQAFLNNTFVCDKLICYNPVLCARS